MLDGGISRYFPYWESSAEYDATISFRLPFEPEDSQYGKYRVTTFIDVCPIGLLVCCSSHRAEKKVCRGTLDHGLLPSGDPEGILCLTTGNPVAGGLPCALLLSLVCSVFYCSHVRMILLCPQRSRCPPTRP